MSENAFFRRFRQSADDDNTPENMPEGETSGGDGSVVDMSLTPVVSDNAPELSHEDVLSGLASRDEMTMRLREAARNCTATVREELGTVNLRFGPRLDFQVAVKVTGGTQFLVIGASERDPDGFRWFQLAAGSVAQGWVRGDLIRLSDDCAQLPFIGEIDMSQRTPPAPPANADGDDRFPPPTPHRVTQGFRDDNHKGFDLGAPVGSPMIAPQAGVVIRLGRCLRCTDDKPNFTPPCGDIFNDPAWGFGYGNFITVRYDYAALPRALRNEMDSQGLTNGFAYVLFAHMSRIDVSLGQHFMAGDSFGATGHTGCSSGPHLHFELKIGRDETVDGRWQRQIAVHPDRMFKYG